MPLQSAALPKVSVIIPTYNRAHLIGRSIRSVLDQTYQDFEIIVVDDGSNDNTEEVLKSLVSDKMRYIRHEKNRGAGACHTMLDSISPCLRAFCCSGH